MEGCGLTDGRRAREKARGVRPAADTVRAA
jgi:hypothetical protein